MESLGRDPNSLQMPVNSAATPVSGQKTESARGVNRIKALVGTILDKLKGTAGPQSLHVSRPSVTVAAPTSKASDVPNVGTMTRQATSRNQQQQMMTMLRNDCAKEQGMTYDKEVINDLAKEDNDLKLLLNIANEKLEQFAATGDNKSLEQATEALTNVLRRVKTKNVLRSDPEAKPLVPEGFRPLDPNLLKREARLFGAERVASTEAATKPNLTSTEESANVVAKLGGGFYKEGRGGERAAGIMEKVMADVGVLLGRADEFAPTKQSAMRTQKELKGASEAAPQVKENNDSQPAQRTVMWDEKGEGKEVTGTAAPRRGGFQEAVEGQVLRGVSKEQQGQLSPAKVGSAVITSVCLGMWDVHAKNLMVTNDGNVQYFDNTRSLPHSNTAINFNGGLMPVFRNALLDLPQAKEPLSAEGRAALKEQVRQMKSRLEDVEAYFNSPAVATTLKNLPEGWFEQRQLMSAMSERVTGLEAALNNEKLNTLQDIVAASLPNYKLQVALFAACHLGNEHEQWVNNSLFETIGYKPMNNPEFLAGVSKSGVDIALLRKMADDPTVSVQDMVKCVRDAHASNPSLETQVQTARAVRELTAEWGKSAAVDSKDLSRAEVKALQMKKLEDDLGSQTQGFITASWWSTPKDYLQDRSVKDLQPPFVIVVKKQGMAKNPTTFEICRVAADGSHTSAPLDISGGRENIKIKGDERTYSVGELTSWTPSGSVSDQEK